MSDSEEESDYEELIRSIPTSNHYVGNGSVFDEGMDIIEAIVNFHTRGEESDIDNLYFYYRAALGLYWNKVKELYSHTNEELAELSSSWTFTVSSIVDARNGYIEYIPKYAIEMDKFIESYEKRKLLDINVAIQIFVNISVLLCIRAMEYNFQDDIKGFVKKKNDR